MNQMTHQMQGQRRGSPLVRPGAMRAPMIAALLMGGLNFFLGGTWMFAALLGSNGMNGARGGLFLLGMAVALLLLWAGGMVLAWRLTAWARARGWRAILSVVFALALSEAAWLVLAFIATTLLALGVSK